MITVRGALIPKRCLSRRSFAVCDLSVISCLPCAKAERTAHVGNLRFHGYMQVLCIAGFPTVPPGFRNEGQGTREMAREGILDTGYHGINSLLLMVSKQSLCRMRCIYMLKLGTSPKMVVHSIAQDVVRIWTFWGALR